MGLPNGWDMDGALTGKEGDTGERDRGIDSPHEVPSYFSDVVGPVVVGHLTPYMWTSRTRSAFSVFHIRFRCGMVKCRQSRIWVKT